LPAEPAEVIGAKARPCPAPTGLVAMLAAGLTDPAVQSL